MITLKTKYNIIIVISLTCIAIFYYFDSRMAFYGKSFCNHSVLPFGLQIVSGWNHEKGCEQYTLGTFGEVYSGTVEIVIRQETIMQNQCICMQTIVSYGYNKKEMIVHWLGCDSCDYFTRLNSDNWRFLDNTQLITESQISKKDFTWISLYDTISQGN